MLLHYHVCDRCDHCMMFSLLLQLEKVRLEYDSVKSQLERDNSALRSEIRDFQDVVKSQKESLDLVTGILSSFLSVCALIPSVYLWLLYYYNVPFEKHQSYN